MAVTITLHCPLTDKTNGGFLIWPHSKHDKVLQDIRLIYGIDYAAVYDIRANPIEDLTKCEEGQMVLVAAAENEHVERHSPRNCVMYNGEEMGDVTNEWIDGYGLPWKQLNGSQRYEHIMSLGAKPGGFVLDNTIRITRLYSEVQRELKDIAAAALDAMNTRYDAGMAIFSNWAMKWESVLPASMKPENLDDMSAKVLGLLVMLSSFTQGSARRVRTYLIEAVDARLADIGDGEPKDPVLQAKDVVYVVYTLYDKAGSLAKKKKMREKARR